jgi:hypothetical protein
MIFAPIIISLISLLVLVLIVIERHARAWAVGPVRVKKHTKR